MIPPTLLKLRLALNTIISLALSWETTMNNVIWASMGWEEKSCVIMGMIALWGQTVYALYDKTVAKVEEYHKNGNQKTP